MKQILGILLLLCSFGSFAAGTEHEIHLTIKFVRGLNEIPEQQYIWGSYPWFVGMSKVDFEQTPTKCTIWALEPYNWHDTERLETVGHEVLHCIWGPHKEGETRWMKGKR